MDIEFQYYMTYRRENVGTSDMKTVFLWKEGFEKSRLRLKHPVLFSLHLF